jgi:hypothetical protein
MQCCQEFTVPTTAKQLYLLHLGLKPSNYCNARAVNSSDHLGGSGRGKKPKDDQY